MKLREFQNLSIFLFTIALAGCGGGSSNQAPVANAGADMTVNEGEHVVLDGSASTDADGNSLTYDWTQLSGPPITADLTKVELAFDAPAAPGGAPLEFKLTVSDGKATSTDTVVINVNDITAATADVTAPANVHDAIVIVFSEPMNPDSLEMAGELVALSDGGSWNTALTQLTVAPTSSWESGNRSFQASVKDSVGHVTTLDETFPIRVKFTTFQNASVVIGQPNFTSVEANQGGVAPTANSMHDPFGTPRITDEGRVWIADSYNSRVLGYSAIPADNNTAADWVVGQADFSSTVTALSATGMVTPIDAIEYDGRFLVLDFEVKRLTLYDSLPLSAPGTANAVIGQDDLTSATTGCSNARINDASAMHIGGGYLVLAASDQNRILIWNSVPATNATPDLVLGQGDFTHCEYNDDDQDSANDSHPTNRTLRYPTGVWTDGDRLVVQDELNNRVLIWNQFPTTNFAPADIVLGQSDFVHAESNDDDQDGAPDAGSSARTLDGGFAGVWSNGLQLIIGDSSNNRVLIWNTFPTTNFQPADVVLGQGDFVHHIGNDDDQDGSSDVDASARVLTDPTGVAVYRDKLLVSDPDNNRVLVFVSE